MLLVPRETASLTEYTGTGGIAYLRLESGEVAGSFWGWIELEGDTRFGDFIRAYQRFHIKNLAARSGISIYGFPGFIINTYFTCFQKIRTFLPESTRNEPCR